MNPRKTQTSILRTYQTIARVWLAKQAIEYNPAHRCRRLRRGTIFISLVTVVAISLVSACSGDDHSGADSETAERTYLECAEKLGIDVLDVQISRDTFDIVLADDSASDAEQILYAECEPLALAALDEEHEQYSLPDVPDGVETIEDYVEYLLADDFSGTILVERAERPASSHAFGLADRDLELPNSADTAFDIGSIAKTMTAVATLQLVDNGALNLDDTLDNLLDGVPSDKQGITVRQLLNFTSGLREYHDTEGDFEPMTREQARDSILGQALLFEPGSDTAYSNSSYTLAAMIIEEVAGRSFTDVVDDLIAEAGLKQTGFYGSPALQNIEVATGYGGEQHDENTPASWEPTWALLGAGGIASSASDLAAWWTAIKEPGLLEPETTEFLNEEFLTTETLDGFTVRGAGGANDFGFGAMVAEFPDLGLLVVVVSNAQAPDETMVTDISLVIAQIERG